MGIEYYGGPRTLNGLTVETQTFAVASSGTDFSVASSGTAHTFNIPDASATARGLITTGTQTIAGAKTFSGAISASNLSNTNTGDQTSIVGITGTKAQFDTAVTDGNFLYFGDAPTSHVHGNITNAGAIGSTSGLPIVTTAAGVLTVGSFGTTAGTFAAGDDSRIVGASVAGSSGQLQYNNASAFGAANLWQATNLVQQRNGTSAQTSELFLTYTSSTNFEALRIKALSTNGFQFGAAIGSAGGSTGKMLEIGYFDATQAFTLCCRIGNAANNTLWSRGVTFNAAVITNSTISGATNGILNLSTLPDNSTEGVYLGISAGQESFSIENLSNGVQRWTQNYVVTMSLSAGRLTVTKGIVNSSTSIASTPAGTLTGTWFAAGTATTTKPHFLIEPTGTTSTTWSTSGTAIGINAASTFVGNLIDAKTNNSSKFLVTSTGAATFSGPIASTKAIYFTSEPTGTPAGTTQTLTLADGNHQTLALTSATGTVTTTLTVPTGPSSGTIIVKQHASAAKDITWAVSAGTIVWMGTEPDWVADAINAVRIVSWRYNGSVMYLMSTDVGA
jgi:hypothetical protein